MTKVMAIAKSDSGVIRFGLDGQYEIEASQKGREPWLAHAAELAVRAGNRISVGSPVAAACVALRDLGFAIEQFPQKSKPGRIYR